MNNDKRITFLIVGITILICGIFWFSFEKDTTTQEDDFAMQENTVAEVEKETSAPANYKIYIHIIGEVKHPGVYIFEEEPRVVDVVKKAGGFTQNAAQSAINLAELVGDGAQLSIVSKKQWKEGKQKVSAGENDAGTGKLDINQATESDLMTLSGIGESKAKSIVAYRESNGKFQKIEDLMNITGIKEGVFNKIKDQIIVG